MRARQVVLARRGPTPVVRRNDLSLHTESYADDVTIVSVTGEIDLRTASPLARVMAAQNRPVLVVDLTGVRFLAAKGLTVLLNAALEAAAGGRAFGVVAPPGPATRALTVSGLTTAILLYATVGEAVRGLRE
jgi:anti-anti-sigma factor